MHGMAFSQSIKHQLSTAIPSQSPNLFSFHSYWSLLSSANKSFSKCDRTSGQKDRVPGKSKQEKNHKPNVLLHSKVHFRFPNSVDLQSIKATQTCGRRTFVDSNFDWKSIFLEEFCIPFTIRSSANENLRAERNEQELLFSSTILNRKIRVRERKPLSVSF